MKFTVTINCDNAAFEEPASEIIRILQDEVIPAVSDGAERRKLCDINGNTVGEMLIR